MATSTAETKYEHIALNESGVPFIFGTTMKVAELVLGRIAYGWSPEELHFQYPHLSLGQIDSALAYYADHQAELDRDIKRRLAHVDKSKQSIGPSPLVSRLEGARGSLVPIALYMDERVRAP